MSINYVEYQISCTFHSSQSFSLVRSELSTLLYILAQTLKILASNFLFLVLFSFYAYSYKVYITLVENMLFSIILKHLLVNSNADIRKPQITFWWLLNHTMFFLHQWYFTFWSLSLSLSFMWKVKLNSAFYVCK